MNEEALHHDGQSAIEMPRTQRSRSSCRHPAPPYRQALTDRHATRNALSGTGHGLAVQAGSVSGGIHLHAPPLERAAQVDPPWQVPGASPRFVGRERELAELDAHLLGVEPRCAGVLLAGPTWVGKAAVARAWLTARRDRFPDGVLWADLHGSAQDDEVTVYRVLCGWLGALGLDAARMPADVQAAAGMFRSLTATRRMAVLIEGAARSSLVRPLLPGGLRCAGLVTSTRRLGLLLLDGVSVLPVGPLGEVESAALLARFSGPQRIATAPEAVGQLVAGCGGLSLALCVLGARLALDPRVSLEALARQVAEPDGLQALSVEGHPMVFDALEAGYRALEPGAAALYRLLGALPMEGFTAPVAAAAANLTDREAGALLAALAEAHLLREAPAGVYRFSVLTAVHARQAAVADHNAPAAVQRVIGWYVASAAGAAGTVRPHRRAVPQVPVAAGVRPAVFANAAAALDWLDAESGTLLTMARYCADHGRARAALQIAAQMWVLWAYRKYYPLWESFDLLGLECARALGDRDAQARMLRRLGLLCTDLGRYRRAREHLREATGLFGQLGDEHRAATALASLGVLALREGKCAEAAGLLGRALAVHRRRGETRQVALTLIDLADAEIERARPAAALAHLRQAAALLEDSPDTYTRAHLRLLRGRAHTRTGAWQHAARDLAGALVAMQAAGSAFGQAEALCYLAELAHLSGRGQLATRRRANAAALLSELGTPATGWLRARLTAEAVLRQ